MPRVEDIILRDTRANQPAAADVTPGTLYFVTDESIVERSTGAAWQSYSDAASGSLTRSIVFGIGNGVDVLTVGDKVLTPPMPFAGTITRCVVQSVDSAVTSGSVTCDIRKSAFPAVYPPVTSIVAAAKPTITGDTDSVDSTLTGWTTGVLVGDVFSLEIDTVTSLTKVLVTLEVTT